jgi:hypothetical protein
LTLTDKVISESKEAHKTEQLGMSVYKDSKPAHNSTNKKLEIQWLNEALFFVSSSVLACSLVLRNRRLRVAAKRYGKGNSIFIR